MVLKIIFKLLQRRCSSTLKFILFGYILGFGGLQAQSKGEYIVDIQRYSVSNGLTHNHVYQTFQDSRGFIWFVTATGLNFYDANSIVQVMEWPILSSSNGAKISLEDIDGDLWIRFIQSGKISFSLVNIYSRQVRSIASKYGERFKYELFDAALGKGGTILTSDVTGVIRETDADGICKQRYVSTEGPLWFCSQTNSKNSVWLRQATSLVGVVFFSIGTQGELLAKYTEPNPVIFTVCNDEELWCLGSVYLSSVQPSGQVNRRLIRDVLPEYENYSMYTTDGIANSNASGAFWLFNKKRLIVWHPTFGLIYDFADFKGGDIPFEAFEIMVDKSDMVWVGTINGVYKISLKQTRFKKLLWLNPVSNTNVYLNSCRGIAETRTGSLYVNLLHKTYKLEPKKLKIESTVNFESGTCGIANDFDGSLLILSNRLFRMDPATSQIKDSLCKLQVMAWSVYPQKDLVWIGRDNGLVYCNRNSDRLQYFESYNGFDDLRLAAVYCIQTKPEGDGVWLMSNNGLYHLDTQKGIVARYWKGGVGQYFFPADNIRHCYKDSSGIYWFATSEGLMRWDPNTLSTRLFTTTDGLPHNNLYSVYPDTFGFLWMSSDNGIVQFQPSTEKCRSFHTQDGITHNEFNRISHCQAKDGTIYFGGLNGVTSFHPRDFFEDFNTGSDADVYLTRVMTYSASHEEEVDITNDYYKNHKIIFKPKDQYINFQFATADFSHSGQVEYSYKIEGFRDKWGTSFSPEFQLSGLPYGNYTLVIRAKNSNGNYSKECRIAIEAPLPFFLRPWVLLLSVGVFFLMVYSLFKYRVKLLRERQLELEMEVESRTRKISQDKSIIEKQSERLEQISEEKSRFFTNVTHEFRTPLALIMGVVKSIDGGNPGTQNQELVQVAVRNTQHLLKMVNEILYLSKTDAVSQTLQSERVMVDDLLRPILKEYQLIAREKQIKMTYIVEESDISAIWVAPKYFDIIIGNLLSNAIKFSKKNGRITIKIQRLLDKISIGVLDNGRGIHPLDLPHIFERYYQTQIPDAAAEGGTGIGLALARELTVMMNGDIRVESSQGLTAFFVTLPMAEQYDEVASNHVEEGVVVEKIASNNNLMDTISTPLSDQQTPRILIVEDHPDFQYLLKIMLQASYHVFPAYNGEEAMTFLSSNPLPDLIICDAMMPVMDGYQLINHLKSMDIYAKIPLLMLTAKDNMEDKKKAIRLGVDDYMIKPIETDMLLLSVKTLLEHKRVRTQQTRLFDEKKPMDNGNAYSQKDIEWMAKMEEFLFAGLPDPEFSVDKLAQMFFMSRATLFRKIKQVTGLTPNAYLQEARLQQARKLLEGGNYGTIRALAEAVGLRDVKYFAQQYKLRFGKSIYSYAIDQ